jgi:hypothetical protein
VIRKQHEIARHALAKILTGSLAALLVLSVLVLPAAPAQATCSGSDSATTNPTQSNWYGKVAYWDPGTMYTAGAPCSDVTFVSGPTRVRTPEAPTTARPMAGCMGPLGGLPHLRGTWWW